MLTLPRDIGALIKAGALARIPEVITAGAGNDGVEVAGPEIDRLVDLAEPCLSAIIAICWSATLAEGETLTLLGNLQDDTTTGMATAVADHGDALASAVVATGPSGGGTVNGCTLFTVDLSDARQFIRLQSTANLSAANTDTVDIAAMILFGGAHQLP